VSPPRVDFYVSADTGESTRLRLACRLAEKAYLAGQTVVAWFDDAEALRRFDELLWVFADGSFVPHDTVLDPALPFEAPVALTTGPLPARDSEVLINLGSAVPGCFEKFARVAEFLDARPEVRAAGRDRFKAYRSKSIEPQTHNV
jgi:DNA polymerase-3 subunit chi